MIYTLKETKTVEIGKMEREREKEKRIE